MTGKQHTVSDVRFEGDTLLCTIDGNEHQFDLADVSERLLEASAEERMRFEISPSGYGIHWPLIDEDLSINGLLGIRQEPSFATARSI